MSTKDCLEEKPLRWRTVTTTTINKYNIKKENGNGEEDAQAQHKYCHVGSRNDNDKIDDNEDEYVHANYRNHDLLNDNNGDE